ncbi:flagellar hook assembly protein FlgD [Amorphus orientalis]|uniref:Basal-body rod modification protein FlgD n=1 Tax=Amorphus orientalis TaxID=649198 RepID=A0AAE3VRS2_9HYPH|nr:flagellar hook assembly protein FlgD [Amorphus orientalis]MDQ0317574.1 flagellar basal-body rod modification protein FlgD [Amorphus orientalis]
MSDINSLTNSSTFGQSSRTKTGGDTSKTPDYDAFLQLMVTQMKNQDPTKPMDSTEYMAQLASFSQVEQQMESNTKLDFLLASSELSFAGNMIGRTVTSADGAQSGEVASVRVTAYGPEATLTDGSKMMVTPGVVLS